MSRTSIQLGLGLAVCMSALGLALVSPTPASASTKSGEGPTVIDDMPAGTPVKDARTGVIETDGEPSLLGTVNCGSSAWAPPGAVIWGPTSRARCGLAGFNGYRAGYSFAIAPGSETHACVQGLGYSSGKGKWYSVGCGASGKTTVSWGNVLAYQQAKARSQTGLGGFMKWW